MATPFNGVGEIDRLRAHPAPRNDRQPSHWNSPSTITKLPAGYARAYSKADVRGATGPFDGLPIVATTCELRMVPASTSIHNLFPACGRTCQLPAVSSHV